LYVEVTGNQFVRAAGTIFFRRCVVRNVSEKEGCLGLGNWLALCVRSRHQTSKVRDADETT